VAALTLSIAAGGWVSAGISDRANAAPTSRVSKTALVTVTASQRVEATVTARAAVADLPQLDFRLQKPSRMVRTVPRHRHRQEDVK
jgi:hypothetical protein